MTRSEKEAIAASLAMRIAGAISGLGYLADDAAIHVSFGNPGARKFTPRKGVKGVNLRQRLKGRGIHLQVQPDWLEKVYWAGMALVDDECGGRVLVLSADEAARVAPDALAQSSLGDTPAWLIHYVMAGPYGLIHTDRAWLVQYGGRYYMSAHSLNKAFEIAVRHVVAGLSGEQPHSVELPF